MEIPNSIVIFLDGDPRWYDATRFRKFDKSSLQEYIRKDLLLEWANNNLLECEVSNDDADYGRIDAYKKLIDKLNEI